MTESSEFDSVGEHLESLRVTIGEFSDKGWYKSACRVYGEMRRVSRAEQQIVPYMLATFHLADKANYLLTPSVCRELSIELIALVESEERARAMQPNFPQEHYESTVSWMNTCVYDKLAEGTAMMLGYNSAGMQASLQEGILVCRRAGKMECVKCFREYAVDIYRAADDLDMAQHNAEIVSSDQGPQAFRGDRRWPGTFKQSHLASLRGDIDLALEKLAEALDLTATYHSVDVARMTTSVVFEQMLIVSGKLPSADGALPEIGSRVCRVFPEIDIPPLGEFPQLDLEYSLRDALVAIALGNPARAVDLLTPWDRTLLSRSYLDLWFEVRLRLCAATLLAGATSKFEALARQLETQARAAQDWFTLQRLKALRNQEFPISPLALSRPLSSGPYAASATVAPPETPTTDRSETNHEPGEGETSAPKWTPTEHHHHLIRLITRSSELAKDPADNSAAKRELIEEIVSISPDMLAEQGIVPGMLMVISRLSPRDESQTLLWEWAERCREARPDCAYVLNFSAALADELTREPGSPLSEIITAEQITSRFKRSLELNADSPGNFARAGMWFARHEDWAEAERCYARGFRLDRNSEFLATRLAEIYRGTDRARDALAVLDMCLRTGNTDPGVLFSAGLLAFQQEKYQAALSYFNHHEEVHAGREWVQYYRASALISLSEYRQAREALALEAERTSESHWHLEVLSAVAAIREGEVEAARSHLANVWAIPLTSVTSVTTQGLVDLTQKLWTACREAELTTEREAVENWSLAAGLAPDAWLQTVRDQQEEMECRFFIVRVRQHLDSNWPASPGCHAGQEEWNAYQRHWGVLAGDEEFATDTVKRWQKLCYKGEVEVLEASVQPGQYQDKPGVVWQGLAFSEEPADS